MHDPAEEIRIRFQGLRGVEIVRCELDPSAEIRREQLPPLFHRAGQVLHHDFQVLRRGGQHLRDAALAAADVHQHRAGPVQRRPVVAPDEVLQVPDLAAGEPAHGGAEAARPLRVLREEGIHRQGGPVGEVIRRLVGRAGAGEGGERVDDLPVRGVDLAGQHAHRVAEGRVRDPLPREGRVADEPRRRFREDVVRHRVPQEADDEGLRQAACLADGGVGGGAGEGYELRDAVLVNDAQGEHVGGLEGG